MNTNKYNSSDLVELLQNSAVEHLIIEARDFDSVVTIVSTDFEALYAYIYVATTLCFKKTGTLFVFAITLLVVIRF